MDRRPPCPPGLAIGTPNIWNDRSFGLAQAIWAVECGGFDIILLTETKIQTEAFSHNRLGYNVICSTVRLSSAGGAHGGVGLVSQ